MTFFSYYESDKTPVSREKIRIYKILQDTIWSLWTVYKEAQGLTLEITVNSLSKSCQRFDLLWRLG